MVAEKAPPPKIPLVPFFFASEEAAEADSENEIKITEIRRVCTKVVLKNFMSTPFRLL